MELKANKDPSVYADPEVQDALRNLLASLDESNYDAKVRAAKTGSGSGKSNSPSLLRRMFGATQRQSS